MIIWKKKDFKDLGIIVEKTPKISKAKKRINIYEIPGRNGFLSEDEETYEAFSLSVECHAKENCNFDEIFEFLDGYGTLSLDGKREYTAIINNAISFEKVLMFKKFIVQFLVNPICKDVEFTNHTVSSDNEIIEINNTYWDIEPNISLTCSGNVSITINGKTFNLDNSDGTYILDCKNKIITKNGLNSSNIMQGEFPTLKKGTNYINYIGNITDFTISYKKTYLWGG